MCLTEIVGELLRESSLMSRVVWMTVHRVLRAGLGWVVVTGAGAVLTPVCCPLARLGQYPHWSATLTLTPGTGAHTALVTHSHIPTIINMVTNTQTLKRGRRK